MVTDTRPRGPKSQVVFWSSKGNTHTFPLARCKVSCRVLCDQSYDPSKASPKCCLPGVFRA